MQSTLAQGSGVVSASRLAQEGPGSASDPVGSLAWVFEALAPLADLPAWQKLLVILVVAVVAAKVVNAASALLVRRVASRSDRGLEDVVVQELRLPLYATVVLGAVYLSMGLVAELPLVIESVSVLAASLAVTGIVLAWTYGAIRIGRRGLEVVREGETSYKFAPILKNVWTFAVVLLAFLTLIGVWGVDLTPVLATGGLVAIVLGFAARDTIANFIGGISLFFDNTYKLGDFVVLESGERGSVVDIGIRSTTLLTLDYVLVTVPNSVLNTAQVINQSAPERRLRIRIDVRVPYDADLDVAEACMFGAAESADSVLESPAPQVRIQQYAERGIEYELHVHVSHPTRQIRARHEVYRALEDAFDREGIRPPYAGREVRVLGDERFADPERPSAEPDGRAERRDGGPPDRDSRPPDRDGGPSDRDGRTEGRSGRRDE